MPALRTFSLRILPFVARPTFSSLALVGLSLFLTLFRLRFFRNSKLSSSPIPPHTLERKSDPATTDSVTPATALST
ncbi:hypothetical protein LY78DRAFT_633129 [Colletotrichum sublineola]|nr:hypothetical protein LY78DRAFT_633129 [Colletotrichum sublineola]